MCQSMGIIDEELKSAFVLVRNFTKEKKQEILYKWRMRYDGYTLLLTILLLEIFVASCNSGFQADI